MSRAFVKEPEGDQAEDNQPERPQSDLPNYITPAGVERLRARLAELQTEQEQLKNESEALASRSRKKPLEQEMKYLKQRLQSAIVMDPATQPDNAIHFGATVELLDEHDKHWTFLIVGEDEVDPEKNQISWASPLAKELMGKQVGDVVVWKRPTGSLELEVTAFRYSGGAT